METLQFLIMIEPISSRSDLVDSLCRRFTEAKRLKPHSFDYRKNWFELYRNGDADTQRAVDPVDGFHFFAGRLEATPMSDGVSEDHQVELAHDVCEALHHLGHRVVVCANFEERVDDMRSPIGWDEGKKKKKKKG